jgi:hypothetical protein
MRAPTHTKHQAFADLITRGSSSADSIYKERNITVSAYAQDQLSFLRLYYKFSESRIYPYLTAIIDVKDGHVRGITWDDACLFCGRDECDEITYNFNGHAQDQSSSGQPTKGCYEDESVCNEADGKSESLCDVTLHVVWTGTDAKGVAFQSAAFRFSQFPAQQVRDRFSHSLPTLGVGGAATTITNTTAGGAEARRRMEQRAMNVYPVS